MSEYVRPAIIALVAIFLANRIGFVNRLTGSAS
jgi:hypothetical protein